MNRLTDEEHRILNRKGGYYNLNSEYRRLLQIPQVVECLKCKDSELSSDFLGFLDDYRDLAGRLGDMTIIDLGCNQAIQAIYFPERDYIGVDTIPTDMRFKTRSTYHKQMKIQDYCAMLNKEGFNPYNTFAFCCNVPDNDGVWDCVRSTFKYYRITYPGKDGFTHTIYENLPDTAKEGSDGHT